MLRWRLILGTVFIAALALFCWLDHTIRPRGLILVPVAIILCISAVSETLHLLRSAGARPSTTAVHASALLPVIAVGTYPIARWLDAGPSANADAAVPTAVFETALGPGLLLSLLICGVSAIRAFDGTKQCAVDFAASVFAAVYVGGAIAALVLLRFYHLSEATDGGLILLITLVIIVKAGDVGAYTVGRLTGRRKLAPRLSPGKTWEGAVGAIIVSCLAGLSIAAYLKPESTFGQNEVRYWAGWLLFAAALSITGMIGDLVESLLKRSAAVKDSSAWLRGFGGVLDIIDSLLVAGPVAFWCTSLGLVKF